MRKREEQGRERVGGEGVRVGEEEERREKGEKMNGREGNGRREWKEGRERVEE